MRTWVKLYTEVLEDPIIGQMTWEQRGLWFMLMAVAGRIDDTDEDGNITGKLGTRDDVLWYLRLPQNTDVALLLRPFAALSDGLIRLSSDGVYWMVNYGKRQQGDGRAKDPNVRRRVARYRARQREAIFERDGYRCRYCGRELGSGECVLDRVIPASQRGPETEDNLVTSCIACKAKKVGRNPSEAGMTMLGVSVTQSVTTLGNAAGNEKSCPVTIGLEIEEEIDKEVEVTPPVTEGVTAGGQGDFDNVFGGGDGLPDPSKLTDADKAVHYGLIKVCGYDIGTLAARSTERVARSAQKLIAMGATGEKMARFEQYWQSKDWRGRKGDKPGPEMVVEEWSRFVSYTQGKQDEVEWVSAQSQP